MSKKVEIFDKDGNKVEEPTLLEEMLYFADRFYHKNRGKILFVTTSLLVGGAIYFANNFIQEYRIEVSNQAYYNYQRGIDKEKNLEIIKLKNPELYRLIQFSKSVENREISKLEEFANSSDKVLSDLAQYQLSSLQKDTQKLNEYSYRERAIFRELAILLEAYKLIEDGEIEKAHNRLSFIGATSQLRDLANFLLHFGAVNKIYDASRDVYIRTDSNSKSDKNSSQSSDISKIQIDDLQTP